MTAELFRNSGEKTTISSDQCNSFLCLQTYFVYEVLFKSIFQPNSVLSHPRKKSNGIQDSSRNLGSLIFTICPPGFENLFTALSQIKARFFENSLRTYI